VRTDSTTKTNFTVKRFIFGWNRFVNLGAVFADTRQTDRPKPIHSPFRRGVKISSCVVAMSFQFIGKKSQDDAFLLDLMLIVVRF
jgi:hypothetical protein